MQDSATEQLQAVCDRDPIDLDAVTVFLGAHIVDPPRSLTAKRFGGGASNYTFLLSDGSREWVLRRPPVGKLLPTAHDMAREHRVLAALAHTDVPVAKPLALCTDVSVIGAPFYIMERCRGFLVRDRVPPELGAAPERRHRAGLSMIDALVKLHAVDWQAAGLGEGFGRPQGYLERQLKRWHEQWLRSKTREIPEIDRLEAWLTKRLPESAPATVVHGDFRLENCMLDPRTLDVVAIFDWEMSTLGDPLADLGYALAYWPSINDPPVWREAVPSVSTQPGFATRDELIERYAAQAGRRVDTIQFYQALALYKLSIIAEGIYRRLSDGQIHLPQRAGIAERVAQVARAGMAIAHLD
jgi:aminoglycoside phosphotransferase (APT) family kinase protein